MICELENDLGSEVLKELLSFCGGLMLAGHQTLAIQT